ncbi:alpha-mannosidase [Paenibacillaceae bacterium]|nr:alpha-mannosidase [Paenibacillaceae bacterium]
MGINKMHAALAKLKRDCPDGYWGKRTLAQLEYACRVSVEQEGGFDHLIGTAVGYAAARLEQDGGIGEAACREVERMLADMASAAKAYGLLCASHAHIDMNFLWGWDETVAITLNTFRTMLDLLAEYPDFIFSQSQAAAYSIVEKYDPEMLEEIKVRVREGRWEVTASTWVEADKNMPNGESMARQFLYAKRYLAELFELDSDTLQLDFEPDTFGHSANVPETLSHAGVRYYYYCRGHNDEGHSLFRWVAPSGASVIAYKEPHWYDSRIEPEMVLTVPEFCRKTGMRTMMKVYGVGDHGGGPTRRDLERMRDMQSWPIFPTIRFGRYADFFALAEQAADTLPVVQNELNFIFTGCYSSEARIKQANRISENLLNEAEAFSSAASLWTGARYFGKELEEAWRRTLFNQFHDILPGTGIPETRDHALGMFQEISAMANSKRSAALRQLAKRIDTSRYLVEGEKLTESFSEGAGAGVGVMHLFRTGERDGGRGKTRIFHVFNSSWQARSEVIEMVIWDWDGDLRNIGFQNEDGTQIDYQFVNRGFEEHWGHFFLRVLLPVSVPPMGYATYVMTEKEGGLAVLSAEDYYLAGQNLPPAEQYSFVLENEHLRAELNTRSLSLLSLIDKDSGCEMIGGQADGKNGSTQSGTGKGSGLGKGAAGAVEGEGALFRLIEEDGHNGGGNAWLVGRYRKVEPLTEGVHVESFELGADRIRQSVTYSIPFRRSRLKVTVSLDRGSRRLDYRVECDWHEYGKRDDFTPQLQFMLPLGYPCAAYRYDTAFGTIERPPLEQDVPANSWAAALTDDAEQVRVIAQGEAVEQQGGVIVQDEAVEQQGGVIAQGKAAEQGGQTSVMLVTDSKYGFRGTRDALTVTLLRGSYSPDPYPDTGVQRFAFALCLADAKDNSAMVEAAYSYNHPMNTISVAAGSGDWPLSRSFFQLNAGSAAISAIKQPEEDGADRWIVRLYETDGMDTTVDIGLFRNVRAACFVDTLERPAVGAGAIETDGANIRFGLQANRVASVCVEFE